ncbi:MAG: Crp/Fnr family transcriptional regulator [Reichenbachiella sp.]
MNQLVQYITSYFGFNDADAKKLSELFVESKLAKDQYHTKAGKYNAKLSFIKSGYLRIYALHEGKEITQWISSEGEFTTDLSSLIFQAPAKFNIQALTDCELYTISTENYQRIGELMPNWGELERLFLSKCFVTLEERVFSFLSLSAEQRYDMLFQNKKELFNQIPLLYLASMLGMTPETMSRIRKKSIS